MTKAEEDFIEQFARVLLVNWCAQTLAGGCITDKRDAGGYLVPVKAAELCMNHAVATGWVGKSEPRRVLSKGFATAAAFLRR